MAITIKSEKDFWAGAMFIAFGVFFALLALGTPEWLNRITGSALIPGYQFGSAGLYARVCHGSDGLPPEERLTALGYRPGTRSDQVEAPDLAAMTALVTR